MITIFNRSVFQVFLLVSNILSAVEIEKLVAPDLVEIGNVSEIILDCQFYKEMHEAPYLVEWYFNGRNVYQPVYYWNSYLPPKVNGISVGRLDLTFHVSLYENGSTLRIVRVSPELSGNYTCSVEQNGAKAQRTKALLVFSPEREFDLNVRHKSQEAYDVTCIARGVFPPPDLILEYKNEAIPKQQQRAWCSDSDMGLYDAESVTRLETNCPETIICRLMISEAGYTAIREKAIYTADQCKNKTTLKKISIINIYVAILIYLYACTYMNM